MVMKIACSILFSCILFSCSKKDNSTPEPPVQPPKPFSATTITVNGQNYSSVFYEVNFNPEIKISFTAPLDESSVAANVSISNGVSVSFTTSLSNGDSTLNIKPALSALTKISLLCQQG